MRSEIINRLKANWKSGLTVSLVSIPLSVSLAVASQTSPVAGIITAIWAGLFASIFGGSNYNIVGPTGALSGILATFALGYGADALPMLAIVSGVMILLAFFLKLEKYIVLIPGSTIHGFTLGVAFIIALNQLNYIFGLNGLHTHESFIQNVIESLTHLEKFSLTSVIIFAIFLAGLFAFKKFLPKIPGAIVLAPVGILIGYLSSIGVIPFAIQTLSLKFPDISSALFITPKIYFDTNLLVPAMTVALIAILETMISAKIADGMTKTKYNKRKELFGLAMANIGSGLAGGIPATAALARTSLNVKTGATDKMSATISSISIVLISSILLGYFKYIPLAVIGAILVYVAIQMIEAEHFSRMYKIDKKTFAISILVAIVTIVADPIIGILLGTSISLILFIEKMTHGQFELILNDNKKIIKTISGEQIEAINDEGETFVYSIKGHLDYINGQAHISRFETCLNGYKNVVIRLREVHFIDLDGIDALEEIIELIHSRGKNVILTGVNKMILPLMKQSKFYSSLKRKKLVFDKTSEALESLGYDLKGR